MSAVPLAGCASSASAVAPASAPARLALLGTGTVGTAVLARLHGWVDTPFGSQLSLVYAANSRAALHAQAGLCPRAAQSLALMGPAASRSVAAAGVGRSLDGERGTPGPATAFHVQPLSAPDPHASVGRSPVQEGAMRRPGSLDSVADALGAGPIRILIDATASESVARRHAEWLALGIHVVTACKLGQGTSLARWRAIRTAMAVAGARYGDSATVGAGLPLLRSIRDLQAGGDRIHAIAGVLSGSLASLFNRYDGLRPFSGFVRQARDAGYTEPDPREDLSGEDVRRKLLILARAAGVELEAGEVEVESLVPEALGRVARDHVDAALPALDAPLRARFAASRKRGETLRFIARLDNVGQGRGRARVGLESLPADHPLAASAGNDNRLAIWSDRYRGQPLVIQGPGAGADVTAAGLLDDALRIARSARIEVRSD